MKVKDVIRHRPIAQPLIQWYTYFESDLLYLIDEMLS